MKQSKIKSEMQEHGSKNRFAEIKGAKSPKALAKVIVKQHAEGKVKCKKCGKYKRNCVC